MKRLSLLLPALSFALFARCASPRPELVVVVVVDTLRRDALGCYGDAETRTPALDALAAEGAAFRSAVSTSGWTLPSVASLLTGTWPTLHGGLGKDVLLRPIREEVPLAAEVFRNAGFRTTGVTNAAFVSPLLGFDRGFDVFDHRYAYNAEIRRAHASVDRALEEIRGHRRDRHFVFLHLFDAHLNYEPLPKWRSAFAARGSESWTSLDASTCETLGARGGRRSGSREAELVRRMYLAEIAAVDREIGRLVAALREMDLWERCTFVVTADHGEEFWEHAAFEHGHTLYDELIRIPLLMRVPEAPRRRAIGAQVRILDVFPTLFEATGVDAPASFLGESLLGRIRGTDGEDLPAFCEGTLYGTNKLAWRTGRWKLVYDLNLPPGRGVELYDTAADPGEQANVAVARPEETRLLGEQLRAFVRQLSAEAMTMSRNDPVSLHPRDIEALQSLGYVR